MENGSEPRTRVGRPSERKVLRGRIGSYEFQKKGVSRFGLTDPYHLAIALSWPHFLAVFLAAYLLVNCVFATLFWLVPGSVANVRPNSFQDCFFFSIETLATVGYGNMYPANLYGYVVMAGEIICGLGFTAILTGLTFVRFSRPRLRLIFAQTAVVAMHRGKPTLMVRIANGHPAALLDATAKLNVLLTETTPQGRPFRRARELRLQRAHLPVFPLTWTLMHVLDERSPLHGYDADRVKADRAQLFVIVEARDPTLSTTVHDSRDYPPEDIRFGQRYADAISTAEDGTTIIADMTRIGAVEPDLGGDWLEQGWSEQEDVLE